MAKCIVALRNVAALGVDGITTLLLKARLEPIAWLHMVILAAWCNGKAPKAWKSALVVPLYKGKGSHRCTNNYSRIRLLSMLGKVYVLLLMHQLGSVWVASYMRLSVVFVVAGVQSMQCLSCASFQGEPKLTTTCCCT